MPATLIDFTQLSKLWKIGVATLLTLMSTGGIVTLYQGQNASGVVTHKLLSDGSIEQSGSLLIHSGSTTFYADSINKRVGIRTRNPETPLEVAGTASGRVFHAQDELHSSGSLVVESTVTLANTLSCANLQTASNGALSCNNAVYLASSSGSLKNLFDTLYFRTSTGSLKTFFDSNYLRTSTGSLKTFFDVQYLRTSTGSLKVFFDTQYLRTSTGALKTFFDGLYFRSSTGSLKTFFDSNYLRTSTGSLKALFDANYLRTSTGALRIDFSKRFVLKQGDTMTGALKVRGNLSGSTINGDNLRNCDTIDTDSSGRLTCGTDNAGTASTFGTGNVLSLKPFVTVGMSNADYVVSGNADDEIQAATNVAKVVYIKDGSYTAGARVDVPSNRRIFGAGEATQVTLANGVNASVFQNANTTAGNSNIEIDHIKFIGNKGNNTAGSAVRLAAVSGAYVHNIHASQFYDQGVDVTANDASTIPSQNIWVTENTLEFNGRNGVFIGYGAKDWHVNFNRLVENGTVSGEGNGLEAGDPLGSNGQVPWKGEAIGNTCINNEVNGMALTIQDSTLTGNICDNNGDNGIHISGPDAKRITLSANETNTNSGHGLRLRAGISDITINGQNSYNNGQAGINFEKDTGNNLMGIGIDGGHFVSNGKEGIRIADAYSVKVTGVECRNNSDVIAGRGGIGIDSASGVTIAASHCFDTQAVKTQAYGIKMTGNSDYVTLTGNDLRDNLTTAALLVGSNNTILNNQGLANTSLEIPATASGYVVHAQDTLTSSGTLVIKGAVTFQNAISCASLATSSAGALSCGSTAAFTSTGSLKSFLDRQYVNIFGDTMTGGLLLVNGGAGTASIDANVLLEVAGTASGRIIRAQDTVASSGSLIVRKLAGSSTGNILVVDSKGLVYDGTNKRVGIGTANPSADLDVRGTSIILKNASPSINYTAEYLYNDGQARLVFGDGSGNAKWEFGKPSGSSDLSLYNDTLASDGLRIINTTSNVAIGRRVTAAGSPLSVSGSVIINPNGSLGLSAADANVSLEVIGTASGRTLHAQDTLSSSGSLTWESSASGASLWVSSFEGAGLSDCDATTQKLQWDATSKKYLCGTDQTGGGGSTSTGALQTAFDNRYLQKQGGTMTGVLNLVITGGNNNTVALEAPHTLSGRILHAQDQLRSSGSLVAEGSVTLAGVPSCTALQTSSAGALSCNNNVYLTTSTGSLRVSFDSRYVNTSGDTMTGALSIKKTSGTGTGNTLIVDTNGLVYDATNKRVGVGTTSPKTTLEAAGTISGALVHAYGGTKLTKNVTTVGYSAADYIVSGSADDEIQSAINSLGASGGTVLIKRGNYTISNTVNAGTGITLKGEGESTRLNLTGVTGILIAGTHNVTIEDMSFDGSNQVDFTYGIDIQGSSNVRIHRINFWRSYSYAIRINAVNGQVTDGVWVTDSHLEGLGKGDIIGGGSGVDSTTKNIFILNNTVIQDATLNDNYWGTINLTHVDGVHFSGNNVEGQMGFSYEVNPHLYSTIDHNIARRPRGRTSFYIGIEGNGAQSRTGATVVDIRDNILYGGDIRFSGNSVGFPGLEAKIDGNTVHAGNDTYTIGIQMSHCVSCSLSNNTVTDVENALWLDDVHESDISHNIIVNATNGIREASAPSSRNHIAQNIMSHNVLHPYVNIHPTDSLITVGSGANVINFTGTASGNTLHAQRRLESSGSLIVRSTTASPVLYTDNTNGLVGIGTATPRGRLDFTNGVSEDKIYLYNIGGASDQYGFGTYPGELRVFAGNSSPTSFIGFGGQLANSYSELMRLTMGGKLGIGVNPGSRLSVSGAVIMNPNGNLGTTAADAGLALEVIGTASGRTLRAQDTLGSSGALVWEGAASGATMVVSSQFSGAGLVDCDDGTNSKLLWDTTSKRFSCGTDQNSGGGGAWSGTGALTTFFNSRYVQVPGDTMTGGLLIVSGGAGTQTIDANVLLEIAGTASGRIVRAQDTLASSGTLAVKGVATFQNNANVRGTLSGAALTVMGGTSYLMGNVGIGNNSPLAPLHFASAVGDKIYLYNLGGASDQYGFGLQGGELRLFTGNSAASNFIGFGGQNGGTYSEKMRLTMGGRLGVGNTSPASALDVTGTAHASVTLASSGTLVVKNYATIESGSLVVTRPMGSNTGNLLVVDSKGLVYDGTNKRVGIGNSSPQAALDVTGNFNVDSGTMGLDNGQYIFFSDSNWKIGRNIVNKTGAEYATVNALQLVAYGSSTNEGVMIADQNGNARFEVDTATGNGALRGSLEIKGTASGRILQAMDSLNSSGTLVVKSTGLVKGNLTTLATLSGSALTVSSLRNCDTIDTNAAGVLSCGADNTGGLSSSTGSLQTYFNGLYVKKSGSTMTGGLLIVNTGAGTQTIDAGVLLEVAGTSSGRVLLAQDNLASSGTLVVKGATTLKNTVSCTSLQTSSNGALSCNNAVYLASSTGSLKIYFDANYLRTSTGSLKTFFDANYLRTSTGSLKTLFDANYLRTSSGSLKTYFDKLHVKRGGDTMTGGLLIVNGGAGTATIDSNVLLEIAGIGSGRVLNAMDSLNSSGTLVVKKYATIESGSLTVTRPMGTNTGNILVVDTKGLVYDASNKRVGMGTSAPKAALDVVGTLSGASILSSGNITFGAGKYIYGATATQKVVYSQAGTNLLYSGGAGGLGFNNAADNTRLLQLTDAGLLGVGRKGNTPGSVLSVSGATLINPTGTAGMTADTDLALEIIGVGSGRILKAMDSLNSSGTLVVKKRLGSNTGNILIVDATGLVYDGTNKRVGIGTSAPGNRLEVDGDSTTDPLVYFNMPVAGNFAHVLTMLNSSLPSTNNFVMEIGQARSTKNLGYFGFNYTSNGSNNNFATIGVYGNDNLLNVTAAGNVGIGKTAPNAKLDVPGTISGSYVTSGFHAMSPSHLAVQVFSTGSTVGVGSGKVLFTIPRAMSGFKVTDAWANVDTAGTTNLLKIQLRDANKGTKIFSTPLSVGSGRTGSGIGVGGGGVIDSSNNMLSAYDRLYLDVTAVHTTAPKGLSVELELTR